MGPIGRWALTGGAATNIEKLANGLMLLGTVTGWNGALDSLVVPGKRLLPHHVDTQGTHCLSIYARSLCPQAQKLHNMLAVFVMEVESIWNVYFLAQPDGYRYASLWCNVVRKTPCTIMTHVRCGLRPVRNGRKFGAAGPRLDSSLEFRGGGSSHISRRHP